MLSAIRFLHRALVAVLFLMMLFVFGATFFYAVPMAVGGNRFAQVISVTFGCLGIIPAMAHAVLLGVAYLQRRRSPPDSSPSSHALEQLNGLRLSDFWIESLRMSETCRGVLIIHAGSDYPACCAELRFFETEFISCPMVLRHARFRMASNAETRRIRQQAKHERQLFAIDAELAGVAHRTYFIAAKSVEAYLPESA